MEVVSFNVGVANGDFLSGTAIGGFLGDGDAYDHAPDGCWADVWHGGAVDDEDGDYDACDVTPVNDLGLCAEHARRLAGL